MSHLEARDRRRRVRKIDLAVQELELPGATAGLPRQQDGVVDGPFERALLPLRIDVPRCLVRELDAQGGPEAVPHGRAERAIKSWPAQYSPRIGQLAPGIGARKRSIAIRLSERPKSTAPKPTWPRPLSRDAADARHIIATRSTA